MILCTITNDDLLRDLGGHDMVRGGNQSGLIFLRWRKHV